ncbi:MAG: hypothetical protein ACE5HK_07455 [Candidatus Methylomirabilales bacterium]
MSHRPEDRFFQVATVLTLFAYPAMLLAFLYERAGAYLVLIIAIGAAGCWLLGLLRTLLPVRPSARG